ncbi:MAG: hypothetical protein KDD20_07260, partial [Mangrovimonas sp.]|nr:hypothetical protein [Mangrovimonas sp.]
MLRLFWKNKRPTVLLYLILIILLFVLRDDYQPFLLFIRKFFFIILVCGIIAFLLIRTFRKTASTGKRIGILVILLAVFGLIYYTGWQLKLYDYMKTYNVFLHLNKVEVSELPLTQNERIQPLRNIYSMANESVGETMDVSLPHLV